MKQKFNRGAVMSDFTAKFINQEELPLVIEPKDKNIQLQEFLDLLKQENSYFKQQLLKHGGILFRNFPLSNAADFEKFINQLNTGHSIDYVGGDSPRTKVHGNIYTSTEAPPSFKIPLHNELSFVNKYPRHIYFFCETPPIDKGETIIADSRRVYRDVCDDVKARFIEKQLKYVSCYFYKSKMMNFIAKGSHKSWIQVFETEDKAEVERKCRENDFGFKWNRKDWLEVSQIRPAVINHPVTNEEVWFNQVQLFDFNPRFLGMGKYLGAKLFYCQKHMKLHEVFFADGSRIPRKDIYHVLDVLDKNTLAFPWQKGDVIVLDNVLAMHGRAVFSGKRRILTAMTG
ncbi:MAG: TauD/TfdA family dioxygenase [Chlamydiales bacterium]|nr:TauD/TfdA family dioxygenase [Chlamydiales bacterium]